MREPTDNSTPSNVFMTFCVDIGRIHRRYLALALQALVRSLDWWRNDYRLVVYTNFDVAAFMLPENAARAQFKRYAQEPSENAWHDLNLSRGEYALRVAGEQRQTPIWIDLDTIVCRNVDHLRHYPTFFVMKGTASRRPMTMNQSCTIPEHDDVQGNIWKASAGLLESALRTWETESEKPRFDLQGTWNLLYHKYKLNGQMPVLGRDLDAGTVNGLEISHPEKVLHTHFSMLANTLYFDEHAVIRSTYYPARIVQFLSFTFDQLVHSLETFDIAQFRCPEMRQFFEHLFQPFD